MPEYEMKLVERRKIARDTMAFWFSCDGGAYEFRAGQNADFAFAEPAAGSTDTARTFSLANSPHDRGLVMAATRMRASEFKTALGAAPNGARFKVSRARGSFTLHRDAVRPGVFLAGGIGVTPMHSILQWATQEQMPHRLFLFHSNRLVEDTAFLESFELLASRNRKFTFVPTVTGGTDGHWPYERGRIDAAMVSRYVKGIHGPVYYVAGPSGMVNGICDVLRSLNVSDDDIKTEEFGEYGR